MKKRGVSLIVLIVTIIVIIVLAAVVILTISKNNPIESAKEAKFKEDVRTFQDELAMTHGNNYAVNESYQSQNVNVDVEKSELKMYIPSITSDYMKKLYIKNGQLAYIDDDNDNYDEKEYMWASDLGIKKYESLGAVKAEKNPSKYYGAKVTNYTSNGVNDWKIFYSDGTNVYLITSDYLDIDKLPSKNNKKPVNVSSQIYKTAPLYAVVAEYKGSASITDERIKKLNYDYFINNNYSSTNSNMKAAAYLLDFEIWNTFSEGVGAEYAIGGPTIEMVLKSYCNKYQDKDYKARAANEMGYEISKDGGKSWSASMSVMLNMSDLLYVLPGADTELESGNKSGADGMWLASTSMYDGNLVSLESNGSFYSSYINFNRGFRPIVCLNNNIYLNKTNNGYEISQ